MSAIKPILEEIVPALMAAGLSEQELRDVSEDTRRLMGGGGTIREWLTAMATVIAERDDPLAERAFLLALEQAAKA